MVAMMDVDRSGKLGFEEFKALWLDVRNWRVSEFFTK
jgi:calpain